MRMCKFYDCTAWYKPSYIKEQQPYYPVLLSANTKDNGKVENLDFISIDK